MLALVLAGCTSEIDGQQAVQQAWNACQGVEPWQVHSRCLRAYYNRLEAHRAATDEDNAVFLLQAATAFMNGYNQGR